MSAALLYTPVPLSQAFLPTITQIHNDTLTRVLALKKKHDSNVTLWHSRQGELVYIFIIERSDNRRAKITGLNGVGRVGLRLDN